MDQARTISVDDAELVRLAQLDPATFAPLYRRYFDPVYRYCRRRLANDDSAADATGLIFARALAALSTCRPETFRPWLFTIARNVVTDSHRARRPDAPLDAAIQVVDPARSPEEVVLRREEQGALHHLLRRLPADQRQVVELRLSGLSGMEIAQTLGKSRAAVDVAQYRAVSRLRSLLTEQTEPKGHDTDA